MLDHPSCTQPLATHLTWDSLCQMTDIVCSLYSIWLVHPIQNTYYSSPRGLRVVFHEIVDVCLSLLSPTCELSLNFISFRQRDTQIITQKVSIVHLP